MQSSLCYTSPSWLHRYSWIFKCSWAYHQLCFYRDWKKEHLWVPVSFNLRICINIYNCHERHSKIWNHSRMWTPYKYTKMQKYLVKVVSISYVYVIKMAVFLNRKQIAFIWKSRLKNLIIFKMQNKAQILPLIPFDQINLDHWPA